MKYDLRKGVIYSLAFLIMCATTIGQKITIDREVTMLDREKNYNLISILIGVNNQFQGIAYIDVTTISRLGLLNPSLVAGDGLHPSATQYKEWVREIIPRLDLEQILAGNNRELLTENPIKVYPNPTSSILHIDSNLDLSRARVFITLGSLVYDRGLSSKPAQLDLSHLDPGFYILRLSTANSKHQDIQKSIIIQDLE